MTKVIADFAVLRMSLKMNAFYRDRVCPSVHPSETKVFVESSLNSVNELFTKMYQASTSFVKIVSVTVILYFRAYSETPYFFTDLDDIRYRKSPVNAVEQL